MQSLKMAVDKPGPSYWDGAAPPSSVLGVGAKVPSSLFGVGSLLALGNNLYIIYLKLHRILTYLRSLL